MYQENKKIAVFGASSGGIKVVQGLRSLGIVVDCLVDNNQALWGTVKEGIIVLSPDQLKQKEEAYQILIASEYVLEIEKQLAQMELLDQLILKEEIILDYFYQHEEELSPSLVKPCTEKKQGPKRIIFDMLEGFALGGIETWSLMAAKGLQERNYPIVLYSSKENEAPCEEWISYTKLFDTHFTRYKELIQELVEELTQELPCSLIINKQRQLLMAAILVKRKYPKELKILSIQHSDRIDWYRRHQYLQENMDHILCVSKKIEETLQKEWKVKPEKVSYKESPVFYEESFKKVYAKEAGTPLRIGYAGRLEKEAKHAELLVEVIKELETRELHYELHIAGKGKVEKAIEAFIEEGNRKQHVLLYGYIKEEEMKKFWKKLDVFISLSSYEGLSIAMLEAMSYGVVPIVTEVSGTKEFIIEGETGEIYEFGQIARLVDKLEEFDKNRSRLGAYGERCREEIKKRCNLGEYLSLIEEYVK